MKIVLKMKRKRIHDNQTNKMLYVNVFGQKKISKNAKYI